MNEGDRLRILFVTSSYPRDGEDIASVFLRYLAEHLSELEMDLHVIAPAEREGSIAQERAITVHRFQYLPAAIQRLAYGSGILPNLKRAPWLWLQVPFFMLAMTRTLRRLLARERFDIIHAHWILPAGLAGCIASRQSGVPLIVSAHGTDAFALRGRLERAIKKRVVASCAEWTANTQSTAAALSLVPAPNIIPMGVDLARFSSGDGSSLRRELSAGEFFLLFVGRLIESKGCQDLLRALAKLERGLRSAIRLWIVGDGEKRQELERLARELRIHTQVRFVGAVPQRRLPDFYAAADLVVIPSRVGAAGEEEGQSVVALEAFAARACVLATSVGGLSSMIQPRATGALVEPANPTALARAIEDLLRQPDLRAGLAAMAFTRVQKEYGWPRIAVEFARLYRGVVSRSGERVRGGPN